MEVKPNFNQEVSKERRDRRFYCANHGTESNIRHIECADHDLCLSCEYISIKTGECIVCERELTPKEKEFRRKIKYSCFNCSTGVSSGKKSVCYCHFCLSCAEKISSSPVCPICCEKTKSLKVNPICCSCKKYIDNHKIITLNCGDMFCEDCFHLHASKAIYSRSGIIKLRAIKGIECEKCEEPILNEILQAKLGYKAFNDYILALNSEFDCHYCNKICIKKNNYFLCSNCNSMFCISCTQHQRECCCEFSSIQKFYCKYCNAFNNRESKKTLNCNHDICISCLREYILNAISENPIEITLYSGILCFECDQIIDFNLINSLVNEVSFETFLNLLVNLSKCPKCEYPYYIDDKYVICNYCFYQFCNFCLKTTRECSCFKNGTDEIEILSACPGCRSLYAKDGNSSNVKCLKEE